MVKKMKLPFLSKAWPYCNQPRTLSFRDSSSSNNNMVKTINSAYFVDAVGTPTTHEYSILSTNSSESASFSTLMSEDSVEGECTIEMVIQGLRSERLFFEPGETDSILEESKSGGFPFKGSLVMSMESHDPYADFRRSMEEMVEAHGVKDWEGLEELFCWYFRVNGESNHGYIVGAFIDLLVSLSIHDDLSTTCDGNAIVVSSNSSQLSFCTSSCDDSTSSSSLTPCISSMEAENSERRERDDDASC